MLPMKLFSPGLILITNSGLVKVFVERLSSPRRVGSHVERWSTSRCDHNIIGPANQLMQNTNKTIMLLTQRAI